MAIVCHIDSVTSFHPIYSSCGKSTTTIRQTKLRYDPIKKVSRKILQNTFTTCEPDRKRVLIADRKRSGLFQPEINEN